MEKWASDGAKLESEAENYLNDLHQDTKTVGFLE